MGKTISEKILSHASGTDARAGDIVDARVSYAMTNDAVGELTVKAVEELEASPWESDRTVVVLDHYVPASTEHAARVHALLRAFARSHGAHLFCWRLRRAAWHHVEAASGSYGSRRSRGHYTVADAIGNPEYAAADGRQ